MNHEHNYLINRISKTETELICSCGKYLRGKRTLFREAYEDEDNDSVLVRDLYDYLQEQETP